MLWHMDMIVDEPSPLEQGFRHLKARLAVHKELGRLQMLAEECGLSYGWILNAANDTVPGQRIDHLLKLERGLDLLEARQAVGRG
jgi:hypothetical protein